MCHSHDTALYLYDMFYRISLDYAVTVSYNYSGNLLDNENVSYKIY